jgi:hypothetical protein
VKVLSRAAASALLLIPALVLIGCGTEADTLVNPLDVEYNPALDVDFSKMTEVPGSEWLWIRDLVVGTGEVARGGDLLTVHYTGYLPDGTVFDSSLDRGVPFEFYLGLGQVIPGWDQSLGGMAVGGTRQIVIPPHLAYGLGGRPPTIPPRTPLVFVVDLLSACAFNSPEGQCL